EDARPGARADLRRQLAEEVAEDADFVGAARAASGENQRERRLVHLEAEVEAAIQPELPVGERARSVRPATEREVGIRLQIDLEGHQRDVEPRAEAEIERLAVRAARRLEVDGDRAA